MDKIRRNKEIAYLLVIDAKKICVWWHYFFCNNIFTSLSESHTKYYTIKTHTHIRIIEKNRNSLFILNRA
jgi:hypothetical protein